MTNTMLRTLIIVGAIVWTMFVVGVTLIVSNPSAPVLDLGTITLPQDCPTEDSCTPDYHNGAWHITPVTP